MSLGALRRFADRRVEERCDLCAQPLAEAHSHCVNVETRQLLCACLPCSLLFTHGRGKIKALPDRRRHLADFRLDERMWEALQIPVRTAFFFRSTPAGRWLALYPSPAGAMESQLALEAWDAVVAANPILGELEPDVEALLVHRLAGYLVPIHTCYELVGRVRRSWRGLEGGDEVWRELDAFFAALREVPR